MMGMLSQALMIILKKSSRALHHSLLTRGANNLYMTTMNQILSWICRISKSNTAEPYPLFLKGYYHEEISHPWTTESLSSIMKSRAFSWVMFMMIMNLTLGRAKKKNQRSKKGKFISCPELSASSHHLRISHPVSASHPHVLIRDIQPLVRRCRVVQASYYKFSRICHSFYELVSEYMEWHFLHILEPPYFISNSSFEEEMKDVIVLL
jgi:hypothetical protein